MHEAAAATGDDRYAQSAAKMADFFIRTQTRSEAHPELDGTWYRGFDFKKWDYWASDGDCGLGRLDQRDRLDPQLDHHHVGAAADENLALGSDQGQARLPSILTNTDRRCCPTRRSSRVRPSELS